MRIVFFCSRATRLSNCNTRMRESMIRDLMSVACNMVRQEMQETLRAKAKTSVEEDLLDLLLPGSKKNFYSSES